MKKYILKIECQDEKGLIYRICDVVFKNRLNIETNSEFVDNDANRFFMRACLVGETNTSELVGTLQAFLPNGAAKIGRASCRERV